MSSIRNLFTSRAQDFELGVKHFQNAEVSVAEVFKHFKDFILCAKECIQINEKDQDDINVVLDILYKFLNCIVDYVGVGSITLKSSHLTMACHEIYRATCDLQLTHEFLKKLSMPVFETLLEPEMQTWIAKEILKTYSVIVQLIDRPVRSTLIEKKFIYYIARLMDMLPFVDFEFQAIILEVLFRLYTQDEIKREKNLFFFKTEQQRKAFHSIDIKKFDFSVRLYLNVVNNIENNIKSVLCYKVCMNESVLHAPEELSSFEGLWVDFNIKVRSISFYIDTREYCIETKTDDTMWEIVTNYAENISSAEISIVYNKEKEMQEAIGIIKLKGPCIMVRQVPQKLIKATTITMYSTNVQKMKNIFNNDIPKMTKKRTKRSFVPLNRRGYEPLDIISIKSSATNHSSVLNHTINTDIVCNNSSKGRSSVKKTKRSVCTKEKSKERISKTKSFMSQLIEITPETNDKNQKRSYSYGETFRMKEVVSQKKRIKNDKTPCGYGEKFLCSLIDIDELFKDNQNASDGEVGDVESNEVVVPALSRNKKSHSVCSESKSIMLRSIICNNEKVYRILNEKKINETKVTNNSTSEDNNPIRHIRKKPLKENKKKGYQSSSHNFKVENAESLRRVNVSETFCSPELFSSQIEFPDSNKNIFKSVSVNKSTFRDMIQPYNHLWSPDCIRDDCKIDPFDALKLEIPNRNLLLEENPKVDSTIQEPISIKINEPVNELLSKPASSDSVDIVNLRDLANSISFLNNIEYPDYVRDDCKIDNFDELKLEIPNRNSQVEENPKVHSTTEEPVPIRMIEPVAEPIIITANSSSVDRINLRDLKTSSPSLKNIGSSNSDQEDCKIDPFDKLELKMPNCKLQVSEDLEDDSNIKTTETGNVVSLDTDFFETAKMEALHFEEMLNEENHPGESGQGDCKLELFDNLELKMPNCKLQVGEDPKDDSNIIMAESGNVFSLDTDFFETAKMEALNFEEMLNKKVQPRESGQNDCKIDTFDKLKIPHRKIEATEDPEVASDIKEPIPIKEAVSGNVVSQDTEFFETARMDVNYEEKLATNLHPGESLELFNDISKNMNSSIGASSKNKNADSYLPPERKTRIRILANIKIQSAFATASKSNIHTWTKYENGEVCGLDCQNEIQGSENIQIMSKGGEAYSGPATSQEIKCMQSDPNLKINLCNVSKTNAMNVPDHSKNNFQNISEDSSHVVNENSRTPMKTYDQKATSQEIKCMQSDPNWKINLCNVSKTDVMSVPNHSKNNFQKISEDSSEIINKNSRTPMKTYDQRTTSQEIKCMQSDPNLKINLCNVSKTDAMSVPDHSENNFQKISKDSSEIINENSRTPMKTYDQKTTQGIKYMQSDPDSEISMCNISKTHVMNVPDHFKNNFQKISEDSSELINENSGTPMQTYDRKAVKTGRGNIRNLGTRKQRIKKSQSQQSFSPKVVKSNQLILPCEQNISLKMKTEYNLRSTSQKSQHMLSSNCRGDIEVKDSTKQAENEESKGITFMNQWPKQKTNEINNEYYDTENKIEKSLDKTLANVQKKDLLWRKDDKDSHMNDVNNSVITSSTDGIYKRRKLYNPDFPEESCTKFENINEEIKIVSSSLKSISYNKFDQLVGKPENEDKLEENTKTSTKRAGEKKIVKSRSIKNKTLEQAKIDKSEKIYWSENQQKNYKRCPNRSTNFKRLDKEFQKVLQRLKSGDHLKKKPPSTPKISSRKKGDLFRLDFSEFNADLKRRGILKTKTNMDTENNYYEKEIDSSRNGLEDKNLNTEVNDREIEDFLEALGRFCGKLGSGQLKTPNSSTKKKLMAVCNILLNIC